MTEVVPNDLWRDAAHGYAVVVAHREVQKPEWTGLSHAGAMKCAERLWHAGETVAVMHVVGARRHEVDFYPVR
jgi:hypothetical protein